ncbi:hypothetical protein [Roseibium sp.]|uniref:hypothetical protein n=1 Tax=Roseibium sp. TaxID=1936156 RepID=UPI003BA99495
MEIEIFSRSICLTDQQGYFVWLFDIRKNKVSQPERYQLKYRTEKRDFRVSNVKVLVRLKIDENKSSIHTGRSLRDIFKSLLSDEDIAKCARASLVKAKS